jgi:hypothetical protein
MHRHSYRWAVVITLGLSLPACERQPAVVTEHGASVETASEMWTVRFDRDDRFHDFSDLLVQRDRVLLLDGADATVHARDLRTGDPLWIAGRRGAGPGEFLVPDLLVDAGPARFGVADSRQGRLSFFSGPDLDANAGTLPLEGQLNSYCREATGSYIAIRFGVMMIVRLRKEAPPAVVDSIVWPVPVYNEVLGLRQARFARSREGRCIVWQPKGDYFFEVTASAESDREYRRYADPYPAPRIDRSGPYPRAVSAPSAAKDAAVFGDSLFVLRGSMYAGPGAMVDVYDLGTGRRVKSLSVPHDDAYQIDVATGLLVVLRSTERGSILSAYARR